MTRDIPAETAMGENILFSFESNSNDRVPQKFNFGIDDLDNAKHLSEPERTQYLEQAMQEGRLYYYAEAIDIHSEFSCREGKMLSNFCETDFQMDGVEIHSMEGFLQSLKTPDEVKQREICLLIGKEVKEAGSRVEGYDGTKLYWQGMEMKRISKDYHNLLKRAYQAKFEQDSTFRDALKGTGGKKLMHTVGKNDPTQTILTVDEFLEMLNMLRKM